MQQASQPHRKTRFGVSSGIQRVRLWQSSQSIQASNGATPVGAVPGLLWSVVGVHVTECKPVHIEIQGQDLGEPASWPTSDEALSPGVLFRHCAGLHLEAAIALATVASMVAEGT